MAQWDAVRAGPRPVAPFLRPPHAARACAASCAATAACRAWMAPGRCRAAQCHWPGHHASSLPMVFRICRPPDSGGAGFERDLRICTCNGKRPYAGHMPAICRAVRACGSVVRHSALLPSFGRLAALCAGVFDQREVSMTTIRWVAAATVALACGAGAGSAGAGEVDWWMGVVVPGVVPGAGVGDVGDPVYRPAPVYVAPPVYMAPPVYLAPPPPVYYVPPRPIYYSAPPVHYAPPVVVYGGHGLGIYYHVFHRVR